LRNNLVSLSFIFPHSSPVERAFLDVTLAFFLLSSPQTPFLFFNAFLACLLSRTSPQAFYRYLFTPAF